MKVLKEIFRSLDQQIKLQEKKPSMMMKNTKQKTAWISRLLQQTSTIISSF